MAILTSKLASQNGLAGSAGTALVPVASLATLASIILAPSQAAATLAARRVRWLVVSAHVSRFFSLWPGYGW